MKKTLLISIIILVSPLLGDARPVKYFNKWLSILMNNIKYSLASISLLTLFLFNGGTGAAQPAIQWQNTIGGSGDDYLYSLQQTSDGGYVLGGYSYSDSTGDKTENSQGFYDYWVVKLNSLGTIQWQNTIGGSGGDALNSIQQTNDGGYILGGWSNSDISGDKTDSSQGDNDYWVVKLDTLGVIQWQNTIGGSNTDQLYSIQQTSDGGYILGGYSASDSTGDKTENSQGNWDYWVVKLDTLGVIQWQNTIGGSLSDVLNSIQQTSDGGYVLGGSSGSDITGDKTDSSRGGNDYWVVKLDSSGAIQWQNTIGGINTDFFRSIRQTNDGGYILGGYSESDSTGDKTENSQGGYDYWVVKLDASGVIQWQNTIGGSDWDVLQSIQQTSDGGYILGGNSQSGVSGDKTENSIGGYDYWVLKLDTLGVIEWQNTIGGSGWDDFRSIQQTSDGGYILGGYSDSPISGDKTDTSRGGNDYWVVKLCWADSTYTSQSICAGDSFLLPGGTSVDTAGTYYNTLTNIKGCDSIHSTVLTVNPLPTVNLGADTMICNGCSMTLDAGGGLESYDWSTGDTTQMISIDSAGTYTVQVTDTNGCTGRDTIIIDIASGVNEFQVSGFKFQVYPNPNAGEFIIEMHISKVMDLEIKLLNAIGQVIFEEKLNEFAGSYHKQIDLSAYPAGVYNLQLLSSEGIINKKLIVE